jgi:hypothetical protein
VILPLLAALQVAMTQDSVPVVTLAEALEKAARLDPSYVAAAGQVNSAEWARRAAFAVFIAPAITVSANQTHYWPPTFNFVTFTATAPNTYAATITASLDVFTGGQKIAGLASSGAALESARAGELQARLTTAMNAESDFYSVLAQRALERVAEDRLHRAEQQFTVARASDLGAAVQTDSLQLLLELGQARVALLRQQSALRAAQLQRGGASACRVRPMPSPCSTIDDDAHPALCGTGRRGAGALARSGLAHRPSQRARGLGAARRSRETICPTRHSISLGSLQHERVLSRSAQALDPLADRDVPAVEQRTAGDSTVTGTCESRRRARDPR